MPIESPQSAKRVLASKTRRWLKNSALGIAALQPVSANVDSTYSQTSAIRGILSQVTHKWNPGVATAGLHLESCSATCRKMLSWPPQPHAVEFLGRPAQQGHSSGFPLGSHRRCALIRSISSSEGTSVDGRCNVRRVDLQARGSAQCVHRKAMDARDSLKRAGAETLASAV
jgi:hypothetical protein